MLNINLSKNNKSDIVATAGKLLKQRKEFVDSRDILIEQHKESLKDDNNATRVLLSKLVKEYDRKIDLIDSLINPIELNLTEVESYMLEVESAGEPVEQD